MHTPFTMIMSHINVSLLLACVYKVQVLPHHHKQFRNIACQHGAILQMSFPGVAEVKWSGSGTAILQVLVLNCV